MTLQKRKYGIFDLVGLAFKVAPFWAVILLIQQLLGALMPALTVLVTADFIDTALAIVTNEQAGSTLYAPMFALGGILLYQWVIADVQKYIDSRILIATRRTFRVAIVEKRARLAYRHIEDQDTYDLIKQVTDPSDTQIIEMFNQTIGLISTIINVASIMAILMAHIWWAAIVILAFATPAFYFGLKRGKEQADTNREIDKHRRYITYLTEVTSGRDATDERTLFGYSPKLMQLFGDTFEFTCKAQINRFKEHIIREQIGGILVALVSTMVIIVLLQPLATNMITMGLFMALITACISLSDTLTWSITYLLVSFANNREYLKDLTAFCALEETEGALDNRTVVVPAFKSLEFNNVSFKYPGTENQILHEISFSLQSGKHYAFVGVNGAGKTTIIKLLTGQYDNYEGEVLLNGKNLRDFDMAELKSFFSVAYQDFARYFLSVKENITIGDLHEKSNQRLDDVIKDLELEDMIKKLKNGIETPLGKIKEDGVDLSGGQWQRLALARTLINPAPVKILDEPTASLDPLSENSLYKQFETLIKGNTSIFISHRLGSIKLADEILVFEAGRLIEQGNHLDLMASDTHYSKMYESQLKWYQTSEVASS